MRPLDDYIRDQLNTHIEKIEDTLEVDAMAIIGPILPGLESAVRDVIEKFKEKRGKICIILDTPGGVVEVVERIANTIRFYYSEVIFIIPNRAMSAGTVLVMCGDRILMNFFSCLGPIDPQIEKDGKLVPALSYLHQFERLNAKAADSELTSAEYALLTKLDLGELDQFEQARELSMELLIKWLSTYKFKNWIETETRKMPVTPEMKEKRAKEIAHILSSPTRWHSHGRGINMQTLTDEVGLLIEDYSEIGKLKIMVQEYFELLGDYMHRVQLTTVLHTKEYF